MVRLISYEIPFKLCNMSLMQVGAGPVLLAIRTSSILRCVRIMLVNICQQISRPLRPM